jgi:hypothetical protein
MVCVALGSMPPVGGGRLRVESVAGFAWNQWQVSRGINGNFRVERVAGFAWNQWQVWRGIRTYTFFLLNGDMELYRNRHLFV